MKAEQILQLIKAVSDSELTEFKYEEDGVKLSLKKTVAAPAAVPAPVIPIAAPAAAPVAAHSLAAPQVPVEQAPAVSETKSAQTEGNTVKGNVVTSPLVGTFYAAPAEDAEPFVKVGDSVKEGQVLAIVEAMKLMNEIESDYSGTITEILVENGQSVEFGQPLFVIS
nr:acetyl-CoA carboxylase biotin carboxyl carrier protein [uncultured Mediterraneibacter sp.]